VLKMEHNTFALVADEARASEVDTYAQVCVIRK